MEAVIPGQCQLKLKENKESYSINETAVLKVQETNKIQGLYGAIFEIPENPIGAELKEARN